VRLQELYGNALSSEDAVYNRIINDAYFDVCAEEDWWWLESETVINNNTPLATNATAVATLNSAVISGAGFDTNYDEGSKVATGSRVYEVSTITSTAITLTTPYREATGAVSITMWKSTFSLPSDAEHVLQVQARGNPDHIPLREVNMEDIEKYGIDFSNQATDFADRYAVTHDPTNSTSLSFRLTLFPPGQINQDYLVRYRRLPSQLTSDTDIPILPEKHHRVILNLARLELLKVEGEDPDRVATFEVEVAKGMARLRKDQMKRGNPLRRFGRRGLSRRTRLPFRLVNTAGNEW
jgi:hypothetical protein